MSEEEAYKKLSEQEIEFKGRIVANGKLHQNFEFKNFVHAFGFMTKVAVEAVYFFYQVYFFGFLIKILLQPSEQK